QFAGSRFNQLFEVDLWLPWDFDFVETVSSPPGNKITVGSAIALLRQLQALNQATYRGDAATLAAWRVKQPGRSPLARWLGDPFPPYFKYGLAILTDLCQKAVDERLPMRTDY